MDIDTSREYSEHDVYTFLRNQFADIECSDIEDTERYIVFDPDREWIEFDVYTPEEFEKLSETEEFKKPENQNIINIL